MKTLSIILLLLLTSCVSTWNRTDKALMGAYITLSAVDILQTSQADKELNPLLRKSDGSPDMAKVVGFKALSGLAIWYLSEEYPEARRTILIGVTVMQGGVCIYNGVAW